MYTSQKQPSCCSMSFFNRLDSIKRLKSVSVLSVSYRMSKHLVLTTTPDEKVRRATVQNTSPVENTKWKSLL